MEMFSSHLPSFHSVTASGVTFLNHESCYTASLLKNLYQFSVVLRLDPNFLTWLLRISAIWPLICLSHIIPLSPLLIAFSPSKVLLFFHILHSFFYWEHSSSFLNLTKLYHILQVSAYMLILPESFCGPSKPGWLDNLPRCPPNTSL